MSSISSIGGYSAYSPYQSMVKNVAAEKPQDVSAEKPQESGMAKMQEKIKELSDPNKTSDPQEVKTATEAIKEKAAEKAEAEEEAAKTAQKPAFDPAQILSYTSKAAMDLNVAAV